MPSVQFIVVHGPLMVIGFLGTLIGLERAVALGRVWPYGIPALSGVSALSALAALPVQVSAPPAVAASLLLIAVFVALYRQYPSEHFVIMGLSAVAWLVGNIIWFESLPLFHAVPWWAGFLVLMIAGERLELSRVRRPSVTIRAIFHASVAIVLIGPRRFRLGISFRRACCGPWDCLPLHYGCCVTIWRGTALSKRVCRAIWRFA